LSDAILTAKAGEVLAACGANRLRLATAESCTGGMVAAALTDIAGSSDVVERGIVSYSNAAKMEMLGVSAQLILAHGAVSPEVAEAMVLGALAQAPVDLAVSITGIAGPGGATATKPVGLVYFGIARRHGTCRTERHVFAGDRAAIRYAATLRALELLADAAK
jgi:nicotinamide-nucleotide amidase